MANPNYNQQVKQSSKDMGWGKSGSWAANYLKGIGGPAQMQLADNAYKDWLGGLDTQRRDFYKGQIASMSQMPDYSGFRNDLQGNLDYVKSMEPGRRNTIGQQIQLGDDMIQSGQNLARQNNMGNRLASTNAYAQGLGQQAQQQGAAQAGMLKRAGLSDASQLGAKLGAQNQAMVAGNQAMGQAMSPQASAQAAQAVAQGMQQAIQGGSEKLKAYSQTADGAKMLSEIQSKIVGLDQAQLSQILTRIQAIQGMYGELEPDLEALFKIAQLSMQSRQTDAATKKQGFNFGGLIGGIANAYAGNWAGAAGALAGGGGKTTPTGGLPTQDGVTGPWA